MTTWGLMRVIFALGCGLGLLIAMANLFSCPPPYRAICTNNLKQIMLAMHNYRDVHGSFPPAYVADANGRPMHSWRVLILPYLEHQALHDRYDFGEPWDGPNNIKLLGEMPHVFHCSSRSREPIHLTSYAAIVGPGTMFPGAEAVDVGDVNDGTDGTLMVVEVQNVRIPWTAPVDLDERTMSLTVNDPERPGISGRHPGGANVGMADGMASFISERISPGSLRALITRAGGERIDVYEALHPK